MPPADRPTCQRVRTSGRHWPDAGLRGRAVLTVLTIVLAFGVGISLGLLGGGGSVLSVPLLVYVAGWNPHQAAAGSLFVVGVTAWSAWCRTPVRGASDGAPDWSSAPPGWSARTPAGCSPGMCREACCWGRSRP